jgi:2-polyprenyl-3-methyl-5-hydroxy-6-metoxy-1,4-benzoquinol methylase
MSIDPAIDAIIEQALSYYPDGPLRHWLRLKSKIGQMPTDMFVPYLNGKQPGSILEIGCGYGFLSNCLSIRFADAKVLGIDINTKRINGAKATVQGRTNISFEHVNAFDLPDAQWDCIILVDVIHHVARKNQEEIVKTCFRLLKPGGTLIIREMDPGADPIKFVFSHAWEYAFYREVWKSVSVKMMTNWFNNCGLADMKVFLDAPRSFFFPYVTYSASKV